MLVREPSARDVLAGFGGWDDIWDTLWKKPFGIHFGKSPSSPIPLLCLL